MSSRTTERRLRVVGALLVAAAIGWTLWTGRVDGANPWPTAIGFAAVAGAYAAGTRLHAVRWTVTATPAIAGAALLLALEPFTSGSEPLGYGNANGALYAMLAFAGVRALVAERATAARSRRAAAAFTTVCVGGLALTGSAGAAGAFAAAVAIAGVAMAVRRPWAAIPGAATALVLVLGVVGAIGAGAGPDRPADDSFGIRVQLWRAAVDELRDDPLEGAGAGRFEAVNPVSDDVDLRRAHSLPLEHAAEQGAPGLVLLLALPGWALARLWSVRERRPAYVAVASAVIICTAAQGCFDWVLVEPAITLPAAALVGSAVPPRPRWSPDPGNLGSRRLRR